MIRNRMAGVMGVLLAAALLAGCATTRPSAATGAASVPSRSAATPMLVQLPVKPAEGSLWSDTAPNLFGDLKARRVGDTVTVDIVENTSSSLDANTSSSRQSSVDAGVDNLFGYMRALEVTNPNLNRDNKGSLGSKLIAANMTNSFTGKGSSDRSSQVTASVGARVVQVLPNGNLVIVGKRETRVN
jgi:flagellar L-ring protein precursor FlgH